MTDDTERQLVICKNCGDEHYLDERKHRSASSFCPECRMRGGYILDEARELYQDEIRTDGGQPVDGTERRDPTEDPRACSRCGVHISFLIDDYCDSCAREIGARGEMVRCMGCGQDGPEEQMESVEISEPDEYYPTIRYLCRDCSGGEA
jgi:hypothetical protein